MCHTFGLDGFEIIRKSPGISSHNDKCEHFFPPFSLFFAFYLISIFSSFSFTHFKLNSVHSSWLDVSKYLHSFTYHVSLWHVFIFTIMSSFFRYVVALFNMYLSRIESFKTVWLCGRGSGAIGKRDTKLYPAE